MTQPLLAELVPGRLYVIAGYPGGRSDPPWYLHNKDRTMLLLSVERIVSGQYAGYEYSAQCCGYFVRFLDTDGHIVQDQFQHGSWLHDRIYDSNEQQ